MTTIFGIFAALMAVTFFLFLIAGILSLIGIIQAILQSFGN